MKNLMSTLLVTIALLVGFSAFAGGNEVESVGFKAGIYTHAQKVVSVHFDRQAAGAVVIVIKNTKGEVMFSESVKYHKLVVKKYDLAALPAGEYKVEVRHADKLISQEVVLK